MSAPEISRRNFCKCGSSLVLAGFFPSLSSEAAAGQNSETLKELHTPKLILPAMTKNGTHVPIIARMNHPLEQKHYIRQIQFLNESDPVPSKGFFIRRLPTVRSISLSRPGCTAAPLQCWPSPSATYTGAGSPASASQSPKDKGAARPPGRRKKVRPKQKFFRR